MSEELKPCPFCGGPPVQKWADGGQAACWIQCTSCGAKGPWANIGHGADPATVWNRRPQEEELRTTLRKHHDWHINQGEVYAPDGKGGYTSWDGGDAYADSPLGDETTNLLVGNPIPSPTFIGVDLASGPDLHTETHHYVPSKGDPTHCKVCGYPECERLKHTSDKRGDENA